MNLKSSTKPQVARGILLTVAALVGCGESPPLEILTSEQKLAINSPSDDYSASFYSRWESPSEITLCFRATPGVSFSIDHGSRANNVVELLNNKIGAATGLTFQRSQSDGCENPSWDSIPIELDMNSSAAGHAASGRGNRVERHDGVDVDGRYQAKFGAKIAQPRDVFDGVVLHEMIHALGLGHEHQRALNGSREYSLCEYEQEKFDSDPSNKNLRIEPDMIPITEYDECSIMDYCRATRPQCAHLGKGDLSKKDEVGLEMLYPKELPSLPGFECSGCLSIARTFLENPTSGFTMRSDNGLIRDQWSASGAKQWWAEPFNGVIIRDFEWTLFGQSEVLATGNEIYPSDLPAGQLWVSFSALNVRSNTEVAGSLFVEVNDSAWTAVLSPLL